MQRLKPGIRVFVTAAAVCTIGVLGAQSALAQSLQYQSVRNVRGSITGVVSDDHGGPIAGAMVSALGTVTVAKAITDATGFFSIDALPIGDYTLQAHLTGFLGSSRATVRVSGLLPALQRLQLRRLNSPVATSGTTSPVPARPIMAAGFGLPEGTLADQPDASETSSDSTVARDDHPHNETAWRLRHARRSILKDEGPLITVVERDGDIATGSLFERAMDSAASLATTFFTDLPFSGEVNLLTTGAFGPGEMFSGDLLPRGVAYMAIGAPTPAGDWSVRAAMNQGDLSSWIVAGAFQSHLGGENAHVYKFGYSYSAQDYLGGNPAALMAATDGSRNVGELFALDRWSITPALSVEYGGRYGRYDYLRPGGLFSPKVGVTVEPIKNTRVSATVAQRMLAPGAEEFVASATPGPWLPPERTFAPLGGPGPGNTFSVERARYIDLLIEHDFDSNYAVGVRRFYQSVDDQLVTLFGLNVPGGPQSVGHYYVANAGSLGADGWAVRVSSTSKRLSGSIDYSVTRARWMDRGDMADIARWAPAAIRYETEDLHDVTTSLATDIPETATRVFVFYKINTGYTRADTSQLRAGLDGRFDVQINQALPFELGGTRWEVLVGLRNLFRDPNDPASVYDELLVVRPPKRVVGGFLVRF